MNNFDYNNKTHMDKIAELNNEISKLSYIQPPVYTWVPSFNNFNQQDTMWSDICGASNIDSFSYEEKLRKFLSV